jgi:hypothetical protein
MANSAELIERLRTEICKHIAVEEKRTDALAKLDELREAPDKPSKLDRYSQLMSVIGDHITVLGFLMHPLLQKLMQ